jgi:hypothetical protein
MSRIQRLILYTEKTQWLFFKTAGFIEIYVKDRELVVVSADVRLKVALEQDLHDLIVNDQVSGMVASRKRISGRRDTVTHFIAPKYPGDPGFIASLWENPYWDNREIAGHRIVKARSKVVVEPEIGSIA